MNYFWIVFSFSLMIHTLFSQNSFEGDNKKVLSLKPSSLSEAQEDEVADIDQQEEDLSIQEIAELEFIFESSPKKAQAIVEHLSDPNYFPYNRDYRSAYFVGDPGSGKTSMARSIGYKMSKKGWDYKFIGSTELLGEYRNQTARQLKKELQKIVDSKRPTIVVIDELHRLLENTESQHHDTAMAATALWLFLDKQRNNENFFLIGTMNRITKLPKPFKDRILIDIIKFPQIDAKAKKLLFRQIITSHNMRFDSAVTDEFLDVELAKLGPCFGRNLNKVSKLLFQLQRIDNQGPTMSSVIKKEAIAKSVALYTQLKKDADYDFVEETDEERQNRYHIENMNLQKQHHQENQRLQNQHHLESQKLQDQHFAQQQIFQLMSSQYSFNLVARLHAQSYLDNTHSFLSDQQRAMLLKIMQEEQARKQK